MRTAPAASPRAIPLHWVERSADPAFGFRVTRFVVRRDGWSADVSVRNSTRDDFQSRRPHYPRGSLFGVVVLRTASYGELLELTAGERKEPPFLAPDRTSPPLPVSLRAGASWRGTLSGSGILRQGAVVRLMFGRFTRDRQPSVFTWVTEHSLRL